MEFCTNCGQQLGNEKFCTACGTPRDGVQQNYTPQPEYNAPAPEAAPTPEAAPAPEATYVAPAAEPVGGSTLPMPKRNNGVLIFVIIGVAALALIAGVLIFVFTSLGGAENKAEKMVKTYYEAMLDGDVDEAISLFNEDFIDDYDKQNSPYDFEDALDSNSEWMRDCDEYTYEIKSSEKCDKDEVDDIEDDIDDCGYDLDVTAAVEVKVKVKWESDYGSDDSNTMKIYVIKVGGKWYLSPMQIWK